MVIQSLAEAQTAEACLDWSRINFIAKDRHLSRRQVILAANSCFNEGKKQWDYLVMLPAGDSDFYFGQQLRLGQQYHQRQNGEGSCGVGGLASPVRQH